MIRAAGMLHILETLFDTAVAMLWGFDLLNGTSEPLAGRSGSIMSYSY